MDNIDVFIVNDDINKKIFWNFNTDLYKKLQNLLFLKSNLSYHKSALINEYLTNDKKNNKVYGNIRKLMCNDFFKYINDEISGINSFFITLKYLVIRT